jgi:hypothetical protein
LAATKPCPFQLTDRRSRYQKRAKVDFVPLQIANVAIEARFVPRSARIVVFKAYS